MNSAPLLLEVSTEHIDSCNVCYARNYDPKSRNLLAIGEKVETLYKLRIGMMSMTLCPDCLAKLRGLIDMALIEKGDHENG